MRQDYWKLFKDTTFPDLVRTYGFSQYNLWKNNMPETLICDLIRWRRSLILASDHLDLGNSNQSKYTYNYVQLAIMCRCASLTPYQICWGFFSWCIMRVDRSLQCLNNIYIWRESGVKIEFFVGCPRRPPLQHLGSGCYPLLSTWNSRKELEWVKNCTIQSKRSLKDEISFVLWQNDDVLTIVLAMSSQLVADSLPFS